MPSPNCIDIASGAGEPGISLAKQYPSGTFLITDIAPGMVKQAAKQAAEAGVKNARCEFFAAGKQYVLHPSTYSHTCYCNHHTR